MAEIKDKKLFVGALREAVDEYNVTGTCIPQTSCQILRKVSLMLPLKCTQKRK